MEWLDGEDLAQRLRRSGLRLQESLTLLLRMTEALCTAHQQGIVHRDIKPSNIFLRAGQPDHPSLMDFGIACRDGEEDRLTRTGQIIGTPQYMSPEQAQGLPGITAASDVFSLGCVLFQCLTGQPPFPGEHLAVVLGKLLSEDIPSLAHARPDLPPEAAPLATLLQRLLAKDPGARLPNASALLAALRELPTLPDLDAPPRQVAPSLAVVAAEQRLVSVVLALPPGACGIEFATAELDGDSAHRDSQAGGSFDTQALSAALIPIGVQLEQLADGSLVATATAEDQSPVDPVLRTARTAFLIKDRWPQAQVVLATGRALLHNRIPQGEVMERISAVLQEAETAPIETTNGVLSDSVSGNLLETRYAMLRQGSLCLLQGELGLLHGSRRLLGKPTPCVGRERELALLDGLFAQCCAESVSCAALVIAPAGGGKSRLRDEFIRRLRERQADAQIVVARADVLNAGAAYILLGEILRQLCDIHESEPLPVRQEKLRLRVARHFQAAELLRLAAFLGEVCDCKLADDPSVRAARQDPRLMATQVEQALIDFLGALCRERALVIFLEDLHWGDALTVRLLGEALGALAEMSFLVVALARPEVKSLFPDLWVRHAVQELRLPALPRKACDRLIEQVLGPEADPQLRAKLVAQAGGNPLLLEELIREASEGHINELPPTVLALLQTRIDRLDLDARRVLRFASVYGETFWRGGLDRMLDPDSPREEVSHWLDRLCHQELIERRPDCRFPNEVEYGFRHALVREAAYGLLIDEDRPRCHRTALEYLLRLAERDPLLLAGHAERGGLREQAVFYYTAAAQQALNCNDLAQVDEYAERAFACGAQGPARGELRCIQALAAHIGVKWNRVKTLGNEAVQLLPAYGPSWCLAHQRLFLASYVLDSQEDFTSLVFRFVGGEPEPAALSIYVKACALTVAFAAQRGAMGALAVLTQRIAALEPLLAEGDGVRAFVSFTRGDALRSVQVDPDQQVATLQRSAATFLKDAMTLEYRVITTNLGYAEADRGDFAQGAERVRELVRSSQSDRDLYSLMYAQIHLAALLTMSEQEANLHEAASLIDTLRQLPGLSPGYQGWLHGLCSAIALLRGQADSAEQEARHGLALVKSVPFRHLTLRTALLGALRAQGQARVAEALREAEAALQALRSLSEQSYPAVPLLLEIAQARHAAGDLEAARSTLCTCLAEISRRAVLIVDPAHRQQFLQRIPAHGRAFALAQTWQLPFQLQAGWLDDGAAVLGD